MDWAGEKNVCSAYACPALRLLGTPSLPTQLGDSSSATHDSLTKNFGVWGVHAKHNQANSCNTMQNHAKNHVMPCKKSCKTSYSSGPYIYIRTRGIAFFFSAKPCKKLFSSARAGMAGENARPTKKNWPRKKRMASWARQRQQITEAADGGARARTGADGAVVLNLRRGPGAYALLSRADGQLTRAGQHYYSHLGLRPPSRDSCAPCREEHRLTKLGKGFCRDKYYEYLVHVLVIIRGRRRSGRNAGAGYERRDWLPVNELGIVRKEGLYYPINFRFLVSKRSKTAKFCPKNPLSPAMSPLRHRSVFGAKSAENGELRKVRFLCPASNVLPETSDIGGDYFGGLPCHVGEPRQADVLCGSTSTGCRVRPRRNRRCASAG